MSPTLNDGDYIITIKPRTFRPGFIYVLKHDRLGQMVKRLKSVDDKDIWFEGDNTASSSSEKIGSIKRDQIKGRAILAIQPKRLKRL